MTDSKLYAAWRPGAILAVVLGFFGVAAPVSGAWALSATIEAQPQVIPANTATELAWSSEGARWCYGTGTWSSSKPLRGTFNTGRLAPGTHWYGIVCSDNSRKVRDGITVVVREPEAQSLAVELTAEQQVIRPGTSASLRWTSTGAELCRARGTWDGTRALQGTFDTGPLAAGRYWYGMMCRQGDTKVRDGITIVVRESAPASSAEELSVTLNASPQQLRSGESSTLSWSSTGATSCQASGDWGGSRSGSGSWGTGTLTASETYSLTCTNGSQTAVSTVSVQVGQVPVVQWEAPTRNEDGTALTDLSGYWLYYGRYSRDYSGRIRIWSEDRTQYQLDELDSGDYYVALTAINGNGEESRHSNETQVTVP